MQAIRDLINGCGIEAEGLTVSGSMAMRFSRTKDGYRDGERLDEYEPTVESIVLERNGESVHVVSPGSAIFSEIASTLDDLVRLPLHAMVERHGDPAPNRRASFSFPFGMIDDLARADDDWIKGLIEDDQELLDDVAWRRFRYSEVFSDHDWDRETYLGLREELQNSRYRASPVNDYCRWWARSSKSHVASDGALTQEARCTAERYLEIWSERSMEAEVMKDSLTRSLKVHPQHRPLFAALVDEYMERKAAPSP